MLKSVRSDEESRRKHGNIACRDTQPFALHTIRGDCTFPDMTGKPFYRPDWDTYFMDIAHVVARRGNCLRRQVAAVIVKDKRIISTGYNGTPRGVTNCCDGGCPRCAGNAPSGADLAECICSHAEENAITQAAYHGISVLGSTLYCTVSPCLICAKMIINAGITGVIYEEDYHFTEQTRELFSQAKVVCRQFKRT